LQVFAANQFSKTKVPFSALGKQSRQAARKVTQPTTAP